MRREPEHFGECELDLLFIAKKLKEALQVEDLLTKAGVDYAIETDRYQGGVMFLKERIGAFFYVQPELTPTARDLLLSAGLKPVETELTESK